LEDEYWKLIDAGVGTVDACRRLGIGRATGYYWRSQRGGLRRSVLPEDTRSSRYLSLLERERIAVLCAEGLGVREIARRLKRAPSANSRELRRNLRAGDRGRYDAGLAHARAREQARRRREPILTGDLELKSLVQERLELQWSPEQIAAWLRRAFPQQPKWHVCHETIYQGLYYGGQHGLSRQLTKNLRTGRALRRRRRSATARGPRFTVDSALIDQRPPVVTERSRIGDFEGDLIVGRGGASAVGTLVDRASGYVRLVHLPVDRTGRQFAAALTAAVADIPARQLRTLTWDQGVEMARHDLIAHLFPEGVFFAHPASPWQRGTNENTNGLLRQYLPRSADLSTYTVTDLRAI
jgi:IS30 family transposase